MPLARKRGSLIALVASVVLFVAASVGFVLRSISVSELEVQIQEVAQQLADSRQRLKKVSDLEARIQNLDQELADSKQRLKKEIAKRERHQRVVEETASAGRTKEPGRTDFDFNGAGWGGPDPKYSPDPLRYTHNPTTNTFTLLGGMLLHRDFRWAEAEFSFDFMDRRNLVWGFRLFDEVLAKGRHEELRTTWVKIGEKKYVLGLPENLPPEQMWKFDLVLEVRFRIDKDGRGYKILEGHGYKKMRDKGVAGVRLEAVQDAQIKSNTWNNFRAKVASGALTYWINGRKSAEPLQLDPKTNGRLGLFVEAGRGPLAVRNLKLAGPGRPIVP